MNTTIKKILAGVLMIPMIALGVTALNPAPQVASAQSDKVNEGLSDINGGEEANDDSLINMFKLIIDTALYIVGAVSVLMLIYGGIRYTISGGNTNDVTAAKNTVLYAIVGIVVSLLAYAIVGFVVSKLSGN